MAGGMTGTAGRGIRSAGELVGEAICTSFETWHTGEEDFLPDFLVGFLLLHRSGLDANEHGNVLAALRGEFSVTSVSKALREQWADEDLMKRDRRKEQAFAAAFEDPSEDEENVWDAEADIPDEYAESEAFAAYQEEQYTIQQAINQNKRTLKDAQWRQHQVKMNRKFFPLKGKGKGSKGGSVRRSCLHHHLRGEHVRRGSSGRTP